jgi:hypothetical protein
MHAHWEKISGTCWQFPCKKDADLIESLRFLTLINNKLNEISPLCLAESMPCKQRMRKEKGELGGRKRDRFTRPFI